MRIVTWNVNGARAREAQIVELVEKEAPDVLCLQEIKATTEQLPATLYGLTALPDFHAFWHGAAGYSGVAVLLRKSRFSAPKYTHPSFDMETRVVEATTDGTTFVSIYAPNGGKDYDAKMAFFAKLVDYAADAAKEKRSIVLAGDINIALADLDVHRSQRRKDMIGQREEERVLLRAVLEKGHLVDVGRALAPDDDHLFTWWPYWKAARQRNLGWRIDYVLASEALAKKAKSGAVRREFGTSDHAPVVVDFED